MLQADIYNGNFVTELFILAHSVLRDNACNKYIISIIRVVIIEMATIKYSLYYYISYTKLLTKDTVLVSGVYNHLRSVYCGSTSAGLLYKSLSSPLLMIISHDSPIQIIISSILSDVLQLPSDKTTSGRP